MLPIIFQHVRELVEINSDGPEGYRHKILTPFPPNSPDFPDFEADSLLFGDPPTEADSASLDTIRAFEFFKRTDNLYYDYSYGVKSDDYLLSQICQRFFANAQLGSTDPAFNASFGERKGAYEHKYLRSTAGDLGRFDFRYTSLSPVSWREEPIAIGSAEVERLQEKTVGLYEDLGMSDSAFVKALIEEVRSANYSSLEYEFGAFDVIRAWMDPRLFESPGWDYGTGNRTLYGEGDPFFAGNDVKLCYAERFYVVRNCVAVRPTAPPPAAGPPPLASAPIVRDHRRPPVRTDPGRGGGWGSAGILDWGRISGASAGGGVRVVARTHRACAGNSGIGVVARTAGGTQVRDHRQQQRRNLLITQIRERLAAPPAAAVATPAGSAPGGGFVWVPATGTVPGHWESARAGGPSRPTEPARAPAYKIAAVKCRVLPSKP
jgi:hypothetical protein